LARTSRSSRGVSSSSMRPLAGSRRIASRRRRCPAPIAGTWRSRGGPSAGPGHGVAHDAYAGSVRPSRSRAATSGLERRDVGQMSVAPRWRGPLSPGAVRARRRRELPQPGTQLPRRTTRTTSRRNRGSCVRPLKAHVWRVRVQTVDKRSSRVMDATSSGSGSPRRSFRVAYADRSINRVPWLKSLNRLKIARSIRPGSSRGLSRWEAR
jgi:hypothetical protein